MNLFERYNLDKNKFNKKASDSEFEANLKQLAFNYLQSQFPFLTKVFSTEMKVKPLDNDSNTLIIFVNLYNKELNDLELALIYTDGEFLPPAGVYSKTLNQFFPITKEWIEKLSKMLDSVVNYIKRPVGEQTVYGRMHYQAQKDLNNVGLIVNKNNAVSMKYSSLHDIISSMPKYMIKDLIKNASNRKVFINLVSALKIKDINYKAKFNKSATNLQIHTEAPVNDQNNLPKNKFKIQFRHLDNIFDINLVTKNNVLYKSKFSVYSISNIKKLIELDLKKYGISGWLYNPFSDSVLLILREFEDHAGMPVAAVKFRNKSDLIDRYGIPTAEALVDYELYKDPLLLTKRIPFEIVKTIFDSYISELKQQSIISTIKDAFTEDKRAYLYINVVTYNTRHNKYTFTSFNFLATNYKILNTSDSNTFIVLLTDTDTNENRMKLWITNNKITKATIKYYEEYHILDLSNFKPEEEVTILLTTSQLSNQMIADKIKIVGVLSHGDKVDISDISDLNNRNIYEIIDENMPINYDFHFIKYNPILTHSPQILIEYDKINKLFTIKYISTKHGNVKLKEINSLNKAAAQRILRLLLHNDKLVNDGIKYAMAYKRASYEFEFKKSASSEAVLSMDSIVKLVSDKFDTTINMIVQKLEDLSKKVDSMDEALNTIEKEINAFEQTSVITGQPVPEEGAAQVSSTQQAANQQGQPTLDQNTAQQLAMALIDANVAQQMGLDQNFLNQLTAALQGDQNAMQQLGLTPADIDLIMQAGQQISQQMSQSGQPAVQAQAQAQAQAPAPTSTTAGQPTEPVQPTAGAPQGTVQSTLDPNTAQQIAMALIDPQAAQQSGLDPQALQLIQQAVQGDQNAMQQLGLTPADIALIMQAGQALQQGMTAQGQLGAPTAGGAVEAQAGPGGAVGAQVGPGGAVAPEQIEQPAILTDDIKTQIEKSVQALFDPNMAQQMGLDQNSLQYIYNMVTNPEQAIQNGENKAVVDYAVQVYNALLSQQQMQQLPQYGINEISPNPQNEELPEDMAESAIISMANDLLDMLPKYKSISMLYKYSDLFKKLLNALGEILFNFEVMYSVYSKKLGKKTLDSLIWQTKALYETFGNYLLSLMSMNNNQ